MATKGRQGLSAVKPYQKILQDNLLLAWLTPTHPLIISDHDTALSHYLNVSLTYKEEAHILNSAALATWGTGRGKIPIMTRSFFFRNKEMGIEHSLSDLSVI